MSFTLLLAILALFLLLAFFRASLLSWLIGLGIVVPLIAIDCRISGEALQWTYTMLGVFIVVFAVPWLRRHLITRFLLDLFRRILPPLSQTERETPEAGTAGWERELCSGYPHWQRLLDLPRPCLSPREQAFLDHEVVQLCAMLDDGDIAPVHQDLPPEVWQFLKDKGFFGMIIPREYGGLGFSAQAYSAVLTRIASRSASAALTLMAPNACGLAELLLHYGTPEQQTHYLPRLARGADLPCCALSIPLSELDAAAILDHGIVCQGEFNGAQVLGVRLNWEKRPVMLAPLATLLALAFKLHDPEHLLGPEEARGITLALLPARLPGIEIVRQPLDATLLHGSTSGRDVFIPLDHLIGGAERIGQGWRMLMACQGKGRALALPASACGIIKRAARCSGAHARVRKPLQPPTGQFTEVEEALARLAASLYAMDAARSLSARALDLGEDPVAISAIVQYQATERGRRVLSDTLDIHGSNGICRARGNALDRLLAPFDSPFEGSNIHMRSRIIFGQGALRAHPYVLKEVDAVHHPDAAHGLREFDDAFFAHLGFTVSNAVRTLLFALTGGRIVDVPTEAPTRRYYQALTRYATAFAFASDIAMLVLGGLKQRELLAARLGDILSQLYLASAVLKRFEDEGRPAEDEALLHWAVQDALQRIETALDGLLHNFPNRPLAWLMRALIFPLGRHRRPPADALGQAIAAQMMQTSPMRARLTAGMYLPSDENDAIAVLETALTSTLQCAPLHQQIAQALEEGRLHAQSEPGQIAEAQAMGLLDATQAAQLLRDHGLRRKAIRRDGLATEEATRAQESTPLRC